MKFIASVKARRGTFVFFICDAPPAGAPEKIKSPKRSLGDRAVR
jgi:hypothetical protein